MSIEAVLSILLTLILFTAATYLLMRMRRIHPLQGIAWTLVIAVASMISWVGLGVEEYGQKIIENITTNETTVIPLYRENPYAWFLMIPLVFAMVLLIVFSMLWVLRSTRYVVYVRRRR